MHGKWNKILSTYAKWVNVDNKLTETVMNYYGATLVNGAASGESTHAILSTKVVKNSTAATQP